MKQIKIVFLLTLSLVFFQSNSAFSQLGENNDWNQFRGPDRNGISTEKIVIKDDSSLADNLLWKKPIGSGFSEITVEGNYLYTLEGERIDSSSGFELISCFEVITGKKVWSVKIDSMFFDTFGDGPRSTPVIGENNIYSLSSYGKLSANSKKDGSLIWQIDLLADYSPTLPRWGFSSSPLLIGSTLVVEVGGSENRAFMGFDKESGKTIWSNGQGVASYCSPSLATIDGIQQIIFANQRNLFSMNSAGDTLWTYSMTTVSPTAMPVVFNENKIFISSLQSKGFSVVEVNGKEVSEILKGNSMKNDYSSSLYFDGYFYGFNVAALQCISAETGEKKWAKRGLGKGSLILVDDVLMVLSDKGKLILVKAVPDAYTEIGKFQAIDGKSWTAPSFTNGKLFLRNLNEMACYGLK